MLDFAGLCWPELEREGGLGNVAWSASKPVSQSNSCACICICTGTWWPTCWCWWWKSALSSSYARLWRGTVLMQAGVLGSCLQQSKHCWLSSAVVNATRPAAH